VSGYYLIGKDISIKFKTDGINKTLNIMTLQSAIDINEIIEFTDNMDGKETRRIIVSRNVSNKLEYISKLGGFLRFNYARYSETKEQPEHEKLVNWLKEFTFFELSKKDIEKILK